MGRYFKSAERKSPADAADAKPKARGKRNPSNGTSNADDFDLKLPKPFGLNARDPIAQSLRAIVDVFDESVLSLFKSRNFLSNASLQAALDRHPAKQPPRVRFAFCPSSPSDFISGCWRYPHRTSPNVMISLRESSSRR
jgi:hypothetical protein